MGSPFNGFNQLWVKIFGKKLPVLHMHRLFFPSLFPKQYSMISTYIAFMCQVLCINQRLFKVYERICVGYYANTAPFYIRDSGIFGFWYALGGPGTNPQYPLWILRDDCNLCLWNNYAFQFPGIVFLGPSTGCSRLSRHGEEEVMTERG